MWIFLYGMIAVFYVVLESPASLCDFLVERYKRRPKHHDDVFKTDPHDTDIRGRTGTVPDKFGDIYDVKFPEYVAENSDKIFEIAVRLQKSFPHVPEEAHALMAYFLHALSTGAPVNSLPHVRVIRSPRKFFLDYLRYALGDARFQELAKNYKYKGVPVAELLKDVKDHNIPTRVLKRRITFADSF